jgi:pimeloyl-ACP methyl ester carboxylesterase
MKRIKKILIGTTISIVTIYLILIIIAYLPYQTTPIKELAGTEDKFIQVNGHTIHYIKQGNGKPLILVHGFAGSTYTWRQLIPLLTDHSTVYALDLLGFGLSDKPPQGNYTMESQGNLLIGFMDALKLPSATLIGHSMGGVIVSYAALVAPSKVYALILIEPGFYSTGTPAFLKYLFFPLDRIMARQFYTKSFRKKFLLSSFYNKSLVTDEVVNAYMRPTRTPNALDALAHMMKSVGPQSYEGITVKISRPTLIVWGERGGGNEAGEKLEVAKRINREIQGSRLVYVKESGHYVQEENPEELAKAIRDFLG